MRKFTLIFLLFAFSFSLSQAQILDASKGGSGVRNPAANELLLGNGPSPFISLVNGSNGQVLSIVSGVPAWVNASSAALPSQTGNTGRFLTTNGTFASWTPITQINAGSTLNAIMHWDGSQWTQVSNVTASNVIFNLNGVVLELSGSPGTTGQVLTSNGVGEPPTWTTVSGSSGNLIHWTDSLNTASPNATIPAAALVVKNNAVNVDAVIQAKDSGATLAQIPNGTYTGGNKRGQYAVDLQVLRTTANMVASGNNSVISGGRNNLAASSLSTVAGGFNNTVSAGNYGSISGGDGNTVSNEGSSIGGGEFNIINAKYGSIPGGYGLTISNDGNFGFLGSNGSYSMAIAANNTATFGNVDLWLANNNNVASSLKFYAPYNTNGAFPNGTKFAAFKAGAITASATYTWPLADAVLSGQALTSNGSGALSWASVAGLAYSNTSVPGGNTIASTNIETAFSSGYTIGANTLAAGNVVHVKLWGIYSTALVAPTLTVKLKLGSTTVIATPALTCVAGVTDAGWSAEADLSFFTIGASGTCDAQAFGQFATAATTGLSANVPSTATQTIDTTTGEALTVTATWSASSASNSITLRQMNIQLLR